MKREEIAVGKMLESFLKANVDSTATCEVGLDPPDFVCRVLEQVWAVEVTRANQQEMLAGDSRARDERDVPLMKLGQQIGRETEEWRKRDYLVMISGPPPGSSYTKWKRRVRRECAEFVKSGVKGRQELGGAEIIDCGPGNRWNVAVTFRDGATTPSGQLTADVDANIREMVLYALQDKVPKIGPLNGYDKKALVLQNTYFFADDVEHVAQATESIISERPELAVFDFVFYAIPKFSVVYSRGNWPPTTPA